ncbi:MAG: glutamate synthase subunit alpha, partial [Verrucomicrobiaceae bacterium]|nr:glutamate synthase subunit alpha [Verrucomicrobiaceae bacterium]
SEREAAMQFIEHIIREEGQKFLGWRTVPVKSEILGKTSGRYEPSIRQVFIGKNPAITDAMEFERTLYIIRRRITYGIRHNELPNNFTDVHGNKSNSFPGSSYLYITNLSARTMVYKGMLTPCQLSEYFPDFHDPDFESALALMHTRFSTNTFPSWSRAHPNRFIAHNGEINTVMGNANFMKARQALCQSDKFGEDIARVFPVINEDGSDSARFDNALEFMHYGGYDLVHAMMMMIPEPWERHTTMEEEKKAFYEFHACMMEPWDGPASITFSDGQQIGAVLDRNGLRPSRYYVTEDDLVIMASEVGVIPDLDPLTVVEKGRLRPGRMFLVDMKEGRIVPDEEVKKRVYSAKPYRKWLDEYRVFLKDLPEAKAPKTVEKDRILERQLAFGYTYEDIRMLLGPTATSGVQPISSMGNDTPLAVLSQKPKHLYSYFKQIFAQVTNPALDCIREELVTATETFLGSEGNLLDPGPKSCRMIRLDHPLLDNKQLAQIREVALDGFQTATLDALFPADQGGLGLERAFDELCASADAAIQAGCNLLILSDRNIDANHAAMPTLLVMGGLHHYLVRSGARSRVSIILETGEAREVHHFATLIGFGADAINPYMAFDSIARMIEEDMLDIDIDKAVYNFLKGSIKGVVKTMAKMGISTVASYRGAQIFETIGLGTELVNKFFAGTSSRCEGSDIEQIAEETLIRHRAAFPDRHIHAADRALDSGGVYQWRSDGEFHLFNPETIHLLQKAVRTGSYEVYKEYARKVNDQS